MQTKFLNMKTLKAPTPEEEQIRTAIAEKLGDMWNNKKAAAKAIGCTAVSLHYFATGQSQLSWYVFMRLCSHLGIDPFKIMQPQPQPKSKIKHV